MGLGETADAPENSPTVPFNPVTEQNICEWVTGDFLEKTDSFCSPNVCPEEDLPKYLGAVDVAGQYFRWKVEYTQEKLVEILRKKAGIRDMKEFLDFSPGFRGNSGRLHEIFILYMDRGGEPKAANIKTQFQIRKSLHDKFLFSSAFVWDYTRDAGNRITKITLRGSGWGHGVGLCQIGALGMALKGYKYEEIIGHYYGSSKLLKAY